MDEATSMPSESAESTETTEAAEESAPIEAMEGDELAAIEAEGEGEETISIGGVDVPLSELAALLSEDDRILGRVKRKVKAAGEEREITLAEALEAVPKAEGWQRKQWEASQKIKELQQLEAKLGGDPMIAAYLKGDQSAMRAEMERRILEAYEYEALSPQERAKRERELELETKAKRADEYERRERAQREAAEMQQEQQSLRKSMGEAFSAVGVADTDANVARASTVLAGFVDANDGKLTASEMSEAMSRVAQMLADEDRQGFESRFEVDDDDALIERIGQDRARRIARAYAARAKKAQRPVKAPRDVQPPTRTGPATLDDFFDNPDGWG